ncbi:hypothetical protein N6L27_22645 [Leisingera sp. SS27]|uniref:hypothetical protein n=1 Tax=Leisingera sp. SS27 TaxID=2979462 RepID=UPI0023309EBF|nr:hypothetical protein [Leisingera sp. SS27]MDC0660815.1 hypothetical protein [Leisingera sp. SS27]
MGGLTRKASDQGSATDLLYLLLSVAGGVLFAAAHIWLIVAWHRYVLANEAPGGWLPAWSTQRSWSYFWRALVAGLATVAPAIGLFVLLKNVSYLLPSSGLNWAGSATGSTLVISLCTYYLGFRIGLILPAAAIDKKLTLRQSWQKTKPLGGSLMLAAAGLSVL